MADTFEDDDDEEFDTGEDGEMLAAYEDIENKQKPVKSYSDARRRHEQLQEEKELARLIKGDIEDWDWSF